MMRRIMALFDEYQSKENAKHVMRAEGECPAGLLERRAAADRLSHHRSRTARLQDQEEAGDRPLHADTVRLIYRLALHGEGGSGPMGVKAIVNYLNRNRIFTRDGGRWGIGQLHRILTRRTYIGEHEFNKRSKSKELKPVSEVVVVPVPRLIDQETFDAQEHLRSAIRR
jgi:hypothetical protein